MKINLIPIGNSKGIRIPQSLLRLCNIKEEVDLEVKRNVIIIKPLKRIPRNGWEEYFKTMHKNKDDLILFDDAFDLDLENWEW